MEKQRLISSYDELNDTFVGKIEGRNGYDANYSISEGVFLNIDKNNIPTSVVVNNASEVLNVSKQCLESADIKISIDCNENCLSFNMYVENSEICSLKCRNGFGIPNLNYLIDCNI
ncbi:hypothetical protein [Methanobrevibacter sp.]|uniref:hypothetical protein n=1 Tax=Methanobrevibacter sp. TaxID=66852 RepID=UPI0025D51A56|nr:hypothetical protein [Methanobrevibacter sp.]MBR4447416.1 hypothetical protein [Methanobrevibacter sp.]